MTREELLKKIQELRETRLPSKRHQARKKKQAKLDQDKGVKYEEEEI